MTKNEKKYTTCRECPVESRKDCPFYEPDINDDQCIYVLLGMHKKREGKEKR